MKMKGIIDLYLEIPVKRFAVFTSEKEIPLYEIITQDSKKLESATEEN